jgi:hypothetical protein
MAWSMVRTGAAADLRAADAIELEEAVIWLAMEREAHRGSAQ